MTRKNERRTPPAKVCGALGVDQGRDYHQQATDAKPVTRSNIHEFGRLVYSLYYLADWFATQAHYTGEGRRYASAAVHTLYAFRHACAAYYALLGVAGVEDCETPL